MSFPGRAVQQVWHLVDASNQTVGRLASTVASLLKGKHKPTFTPHHDCGDFVVIVNAEKVHFSGKKWKDKLYRWHTGYPGGLKQRRAIDELHRRPKMILQRAIIGMLRKNRLRHGSIQPRLHIYTGPDHPHLGQLPAEVTPLPPHTRHNSEDAHFGLHVYSDPNAPQRKVTYPEDY